jgi:hypothetical protein
MKVYLFILWFITWAFAVLLTGSKAPFDKAVYFYPFVTAGIFVCVYQMLGEYPAAKKIVKHFDMDIAAAAHAKLAVVEVELRKLYHEQEVTRHEPFDSLGGLGSQQRRLRHLEKEIADGKAYRAQLRADLEQAGFVLVGDAVGVPAA